MFFLKFFLFASVKIMVSCDQMNELMFAIQRKDVEEVKRVLENTDVDLIDDHGWNVLRKASKYPDGEIARLIIAKGAGKLVNDILETAENKYAALITLYSHIEQQGGATFYTLWIQEVANGVVLRALADGKLDFTVADASGDTIFHMFSKTMAKPVSRNFIQLLARNGAPLEKLNADGNTPLTKYLIADPTVKIRENPNPFQVRYYPYSRIENSFYAYMAEAGANLGTPNGRGDTLIHLATLKYYGEMIKWLLDKGMEADVRNRNGDTPLLALVKRDLSNDGLIIPSKAKIFKVTKVMEILIDGGAQVGAVDANGHDALHYVKKEISLHRAQTVRA